MRIVFGLMKSSPQGTGAPHAAYLLGVVDVEQREDKVMDDAVQARAQTPAGHDGSANFFGLKVQRSPRSCNRKTRTRRKKNAEIGLGG